LLLPAWYSTALRRREAILVPRHISSLSFIAISIVDDGGNGKLYEDDDEQELSGSMLIIDGNVDEKSDDVGVGGGGRLT
jgi:hypothetical protein